MLSRPIPLAVEPIEDFFRQCSEIYTETIDEPKVPGFIDPRIKRKFPISRPPLDQGAAGIVADAADNRSLDAG
jgi:hypothetical protein